MPLKRTRRTRRRLDELTPGEVLDVCGPSWRAMQRDAARDRLTPPERKRRRRPPTRAERVGRHVRALRDAQRCINTHPLIREDAA